MVLAWKHMLLKIQVALRFHRVALVVLVCACAIAQFNALAAFPFVSLLPDTPTYLAITHKILTSSQFFDAWRTPGYPTMLALIFLLTGGQHFAAVVVVQVGLILLATLEVYVLAYRLSQARWQACLIAILCGLNPFVVAWEHTILTETLTFWLVVTTFLVFERYLRQERISLLLLTALLLVGLALTRPQFVFLPPLLALLLMIWRLRSSKRGHLWKEIGVVGAVPSLLILAYCAGNFGATGYLGLSDVANVSLFGKVIEYHMFDQSGPGTDARVAAFRTAVHTAEATWDPSPSAQDSWHVEGNVWTFVADHPEFETKGRQIYGAYSVAIITHHPLEYAVHSLPDIVACVYAAPVYFARVGYATPRNLWFAGLFTLLARLSAFLPFIVVIAAIASWRRPLDISAFLVWVLAASLSGVIVFGAFTDFAEFWRIRFPTEWIMPLAFIIVTSSSIQAAAGALAAFRLAAQRSRSATQLGAREP